MKERDICDFLAREFWTFCKTIPNGLGTKVYLDGYIAGGAIYSLRHNRTPNDYDVFLTDETLIKELEAIPDFWGYKSRYALSKGKFQIVTKYHGEPLENVREFDFKHNMYWFRPCEHVSRIHSAHPDEQGLTISKYKWLNSDAVEFNDLRPREVERCFSRIKKFRKRGMKVSPRTYLNVLKRCKPKDLIRFKREQMRSHGGGTY